jgi:3-hydroxybutyryl-CoA dehydrogenase
MTPGIRTVGVVGLGTMGAGIAEVFARGGLDVRAVEIDEAALERGRATLTGSVDQALAKGRLGPEQREALLGRVTFAVGLPALRDVDLVVEAVPERLDLKRRLFAELDRVCRPDAVLATNTSSLSVTEVAAATGRPGQVVGVHFFNPAPVMKLVEVIRTVVTADEVVAGVAALCERLGKVAVRVGDRAGFIANALLFGYLNDAVAMVDSGYASREDIDTAMRHGCRLPMGPLTLLDLIGLDTAVQILATLYRRGGRDRRHAPSPLLRHLVAAGLLGRKSGRGFYTYERPGSPVVVADALTPPAPAGDARPVATVGVIGGEPLAEAVAKAGYEVVTATDGSLAPLAGADLVLAPPGPDADATAARFAALGQVCRPEAVLAATGPDAAVIDCAMATGRPSQVVGLHLLDGAVVEIVHTVHSSPRAVATARAVVSGAGLTGVGCGDRAGFIANALLLPHLNDAVRMLEAGYATVDDIDTAMTMGCAYPSGPFTLLDDLGLDVAVRGLRGIYRQRREPGVAPAPLLEQLVNAGWTGRRAGRGFRDHAPG